MNCTSLMDRVLCCVALAVFCLMGAAAVFAEEGLTEQPISQSDRDHWAFQPIRRPPLPSVVHSEWLRSGIDAFILARLEKKGLQPAAEADRATLLRRLSFDLTGLPPSAEELAAFQADGAPDAYERQVDRLLASPAHGERWGQHWLDLARFADTDGFEHDKVRPDAWKYRDWVIAALNADLPYDRFVAWQIAGDLGPVSGSGTQDSGDRGQASVGNASPGAESAIRELQSAIPTMFCLAGPDMPDQNDQVERRHNLLNELTSTAGSVLLGLQLGCAQCHDHKYDPISQADFYRLRAVFESAVPVLKRDQPYNWLAVQKKFPAARIWLRGDHRRPGPELRPGFPRIADLSAMTGDDLSTGPAEAESPSRADFAQWLFEDTNPLTARVMANRTWQHHFGRGIFDTPSDVGLINAGPTHPELLDWLASALPDGAWSLKTLHRQIVSSATYRQSGRNTGEGAHWRGRLAHDPHNELYSRFPRRRLDGETLRDAMLASAGLLSTERGGAGVMPPLPEELTSTLLKGQWSASEREADHYKRSIYLFSRRNLRYPIFEAFDRPDANASCPLRSRSTTAPQSLVLLNSEFSLLVARHLAARVLSESDRPAEQLSLVYQHALSRMPTDDEIALLSNFLAEQQGRISADGRPPESLALPAGALATKQGVRDAALIDACLAILNSSEFLYVD